MGDRFAATVCVQLKGCHFRQHFVEAGVGAEGLAEQFAKVLQRETEAR